MRSQVAGGILEFIYTLSKEIEESEALDSNLIFVRVAKSNLNKSILRFDGFRHALSADYENRYTQLTYQYEDDKVQALSAMVMILIEIKMSWISYRQHFFSMILIPSTQFESIDVESSSIINEDVSDASFI